MSSVLLYFDLSQRRGGTDFEERGFLQFLDQKRILKRRIQSFFTYNLSLWPKLERCIIYVRY